MKNELEIRTAIRELQAALLAAPETMKIDPPVVHKFVKGLYIRQMYMQPWSIVVGKTHLEEHFMGVGFGSGVMVNETGKREVQYGDIFECNKNTKRAFKAGKEGMEIFTVHANPTDERSIAEIEKRLVID